MARVHTDFIVLNEDVYDYVMRLISLRDDVEIFEDVPVNQQYPLERNLNKKGLFVLKRQYVK